MGDLLLEQPGSVAAIPDDQRSVAVEAGLTTWKYWQERHHQGFERTSRSTLLASKNRASDLRTRAIVNDQAADAADQLDQWWWENEERSAEDAIAPPNADGFADSPLSDAEGDDDDQGWIVV